MPRLVHVSHVTKITDSEMQKNLKLHEENVFEKYYECPICGNEPFPGVLPLKEEFKRLVKNGYFCPKCYAVTLIVSLRIRKSFLPRFL